jgi:hypothetical protein
MKSAVCLRCDWEGNTGTKACPNCGAVLFRPAEPQLGPSPAERPLAREQPSEPEEVLPFEPVRRSRPLAVLALVAAILVASAAAFFGAFSTSPEPAAGPSPVWSPSGSLVFVASGGADRVRLWHWDLVTGDVHLGPIVDRPIQLVSATSVFGGSVGMTTVAANGERRAWFVRFPSSTDPPELLISGDVVDWAFGGSRVVVVRHRDPTPACRGGGSQIESYDIPTQGIGQDLNVCAEVPSVGRAGFTTFFTRRTSLGPSIRYVGIHRSHRVLDGYTLLSASRTGDLLVIGEDPADGVALFWQGNRDGPVPYAEGDAPLQLDRVLSWSLDASRALVLGRVDGRLGVWSIRAGASASPEIRTPTLVLPVDEPTWATNAPDGTAYIEAGGELLAYRDGDLYAVNPPPGVPTPAGPLVWVP